MAVEDGLIMKGDRLVIPLSLQAEVLSKLHEAASEVLCLLAVDQQGHRRHREEVRCVSTITETSGARAADAT